MNPSHITPRRRCAYCNQPFVPGHHLQKYCSLLCANRNRYGYRQTWHVDFNANAAAERSYPTAERVTPREVEIRRINGSDGKRYYARDADALLEEISESEQARPGHPLG